VTLPVLVDLFCGEGGASEGYAQAGFDVVGWDLRRWPGYRHDLLITDVTWYGASQFAAYCRRVGAVAVHASPPCQKLTELNSKRENHLNLIPHTRLLCEGTDLPYVIENVRAARDHLHDPVSLTGCMFDLHCTTSKGQRFDLSRERLFETNWPLEEPLPPGCKHPIANVFGGHIRARSGEYRTGKGTGKTVDFPGEDRPALARQLMGMPWATMGGMSEAVPPAYTKWIGMRLMEHLGL